MKVAFTGGGTGGHVYPGLAIIQSMQELDPSIEYLWIGENKGMEGKILGQTTTPFMASVRENYVAILALKMLLIFLTLL